MKEPEFCGMFEKEDGDWKAGASARQYAVKVVYNDTKLRFAFTMKSSWGEGW